MVATKFSVKHQGKDIHHPPSIFFFFCFPWSILCLSLSLSFTIKLNTLHDLLIISFPVKILTQQSNIQAQILYIFNNFGPDRSYSSVFLFLMSRFSIQLKVRLLEINGILSEFFSWIHHSPFNVSDQELSSGS